MKNVFNKSNAKKNNEEANIEKQIFPKMELPIKNTSEFKSYPV